MTQENDVKTMRSFQKVWDILEEHEHDKAQLVPILQKVQKEYNYLPEEVMNYIATSLDVPPARVFGVASFYSHFVFEPKGKYVVKICDGTACHVKGSMDLYDALQDELGLSDDEITTQDMLFTLETVSCLGACGLAPVMMVNDDVHGNLTSDQAREVIQEIKTKEGEDYE